MDGKVAIGNMPNWTVVKLEGGRPAIIRTDQGSSISKVCVQFGDKTASLVSRTMMVEVIAFAQDLVYQRVKAAEVEFFEREAG